jgi:hypothetical protein
MSNELTNKKIAFLVAPEGTEQVELTEPWSAVEKAGGTGSTTKRWSAPAAPNTWCSGRQPDDLSGILCRIGPSLHRVAPPVE